MCDKIQYTFKEAQSAKKGMAISRNKSLDVYKCRDCGHFHLTSRSSRKKLQPLREKHFKYKPNYKPKND